MSEGGITPTEEDNRVPDLMDSTNSDSDSSDSDSSSETENDQPLDDQALWRRDAFDQNLLEPMAEALEYAAKRSGAKCYQLKDFQGLALSTQLVRLALGKRVDGNMLDEGDDNPFAKRLRSKASASSQNTHRHACWGLKEKKKEVEDDQKVPRFHVSSEAKKEVRRREALAQSSERAPYSKEDWKAARTKIFDNWKEKVIKWENVARAKGHIPVVETLCRPDRVIRFFQQNDPEIGYILRLLRKHEDEGSQDDRKPGQRGVPISLYGGPSMYYVFDRPGLLEVINSGGRTRSFIPKDMRAHYLHTTHRNRTLCHPGEKKMLAKMQEYVYWPGMENDINEFVAGCLACARSKTKRPNRQGKTVRVFPEQPLSVVGVDVYGPLPRTAEGYTHILSVQDHFSRFVKLIPVRETDSATLAQALFTEWIQNYGTPDLMVFDSGSNFRSSLFIELGRLMGIDMHPFPSYAQYRNGKVERIHQYLGARLRIWNKNNNHNWMEALPYIQMSHHLLPMARYGKSPMELLFGVSGKLPFLRKGVVEGSYSKLALSHLERHHLSLTTIRQDILALEKRIQQQELEKVNKRRLECSFKPGDYAIVWAKGNKHKTECVWSDLVEIVNRVNENTYTVRYPNNKQEAVPATRLKLVSPWDRSEEAASGPFFDDYPRMIFEGASSGDAYERHLKTLPRMVVYSDVTPIPAATNKPHEYKQTRSAADATEDDGRKHEDDPGSVEEDAGNTSGGEEKREPRILPTGNSVTRTPLLSLMDSRGTITHQQEDTKKVSLIWGDFVVYTPRTQGKEKDWFIGQYLTQPVDITRGRVVLRGLHVYNASLRRRKFDAGSIRWWYAWTASKKGAPTTLQHFDKGPYEAPNHRVRVTGHISPEEVEVEQSDIVTQVTMNKDGTISHDSWSNIVQHVQVNDLAGAARRWEDSD